MSTLDKIKPSYNSKPKKAKVKMNRLRRKKKEPQPKEQTVVKPTIAASGGYPAYGDPMREEPDFAKNPIIQGETLE